MISINMKILRKISFNSNNILGKSNFSTFSGSINLFEVKSKKNLIEDKIGLIINAEDKPNSIMELTSIVSKYDINISHIKSKPPIFYGKSDNKGEIHLDINYTKNDKSILKMIEEIQERIGSVSINKLKNIPWFPKCIEDLNFIGENVLEAGIQLNSDHPGFNDLTYRERRSFIEKQSKTFKFKEGSIFPIIEYTEDETKLWQYMWDQLIPLQMKYSCNEYKESLENFIKNGIFNRNIIPQMSEINEFFAKNTKMFFRPIGGLLSQREFLNSLAFKVFPSTQYLRHSSKPHYTPEPDIIHEFFGHVCMFINKEFCEFSQEIGLASLGANDDEISRLATIYWYTIEFGVCKQNDDIKIYGGGILSSPSEILHSMSADKCKYLEFDLEKISRKAVDICNIQTEYFLAPSFNQMKILVKKYIDSLNKPFNVSYNTVSKTILVDRKIDEIEIQHI